MRPLSFLLASALAVFGAPCVALAQPHQTPEFSFVGLKFGNVSGYNQVAPGVAPTWKNDASGAAIVNGVVVMVDDLLSGVRMWRADEDEATQGVNVALPTLHKDLEGATQVDGKLVITTSMTGKADGDQALNVLSQFDVDPATLTLSNQVSVNHRQNILNAIESTLGRKDPEWFARTQTFGEKDGNLNIEGISEAHPSSGYDLVWGLRSPLFAPDFAAFEDRAGKSTQILDRGHMILVFVKNAFKKKPKFMVKTVDLEGKGVRSIEYIPALRGYLISAGPVPKADNYKLWLYRPSPTARFPDQLVDLSSKLPEFAKLGRPEGILKAGGLNVTIFSENDPTFPAVPPFNYIEATINYD